jgi:hypothetical protein
MPKQIATATMEGKRKREGPRKGWTDEVEKDVNTMGIKNRQPVARKWRKTEVETKGHN